MKKYTNCTKEELTEIIKNKNVMIQKLNGQVFYYKEFKKSHKEAQQKYYKRLDEIEKAQNKNKNILKKFYEQFEKVEISLEQFSTKISDVNRFKELNEPISGDKWDYLDHYYFKPLEYELNKLQKIYSEIEKEQ